MQPLWVLVWLVTVFWVKGNIMAAAAIPAIGAVAGAAMAKKSGQNPLLGAALGGLGGYAAGPALSGLGAASGMGGAASGLGAAGSGLAQGATQAALGASVPGLTMGGEQAAMLAAQNAGFGLGGVNATAQAAGGGLLSNFGGKDAVMAGGKMLMGGMQQTQQQPMPQPMPMQQRQPQRSMMSLGQQPMALGGNINFMNRG